MKFWVIGRSARSSGLAPRARNARVEVLDVLNLKPDLKQGAFAAALQLFDARSLDRLDDLEKRRPRLAEGQHRRLQLDAGPIDQHLSRRLAPEQRHVLSDRRVDVSGENSDMMKTGDHPAFSNSALSAKRSSAPIKRLNLVGGHILSVMRRVVPWELSSAKVDSRAAAAVISAVSG